MGLVRYSLAPSFIASTAILTSLIPVIMTISVCAEFFFDIAQNLQTIGARHFDVENGNIKILLLYFFYRFHTVGCLFNIKSFINKPCGNCHAKRIFIIGDEDLNFFFTHKRSRFTG